MRKLDEDSIIQSEVTHYEHHQIPFKSSVLHSHANQPSIGEDDGQQQQLHLPMDKLHQMNNNHLPHYNEERLSTPTHVLSSLSSFDISLKVGDNLNDPRGTNKDASPEIFSKN